MATYLANTANRDVITLGLSKAEAEALLDAVAQTRAMPGNNMTRAALDRAVSALHAATNTSARRAGFFD
jgi:predicted DNA-binding transcriptional regulator YafY